MQSIVITEKATQQKNVLKAVGDTYGDVLAASGHLFTLVAPETYGGPFADWRSFHTLYPPKWEKEPTTDTRPGEQARLDGHRSRLAAGLKKAQRVYIATDADREGELIGREIVEAYGFKGELFRVLFSSEDPASLKAAFAEAVPIARRESIYQAALARERADAIWNLSLTRAATSALIPQANRGVIGIGRVKTPTHAIICRRELQIRSFKPDGTYSVRVTLETPAGPLPLTVPKEAVFATEAEAVAAAASAVAAGTATLTATTKTGKKAPPKPPSLGTMQVIAGRWGWSAAKTLETGQELYSSKQVITYIRAAAHYWPEAMIPTVPAILAGLATVPDLTQAIPATPTIRSGKGGFFSDAGLAGESHHALAPNANTIAGLSDTFATLSDDERTLFLEVARLFIRAVSPDEQFITHSFQATIEGFAVPLTASGRQTTEPGWRALPDAAGDDADDEAVSAFAESGTYRIISAEPFKRTSNPPTRYTQGTLIQAMMNAWRFIPDKAQRDRLKEANGIGTEATRANVIEGLISQGLIEDNKTLRPTDAGLRLFLTLDKIDPALVDPGTTALWEEHIDRIAAGTATESEFVTKIADETTRLCGLIRACPPSPVFGTVDLPTPAMVKAVEAIARKGAAPPEGWRRSSALARSYLDQHATKKETSK